METVTLAGRVTGEGLVELDEPVPLPPGPARITVQSLKAPSSFQWPSEEERKRKKKALDSLAGTISDEEAQEVLRIIEDEFEKVDLDEWR